MEKDAREGTERQTERQIALPLGEFVREALYETVMQVGLA